MKNYDYLTGLYSKEGFFEKVAEVLTRNPEGKYQIIISNIKQFKLVNDLFGSQAGDELLVKIANTLKNSAIPDAEFGRIGADNFCIFVSTEHSEEILDLLLETEFYANEENSYRVYFDAGVYDITDPDLPVYIMCDRAKMALSTLKGDRLEKIAYYSDELRERALKEQILIGELQRAIDNREILIYFQGIFDSFENMLGAEALVRWQHPEKGLMSAGEFIKILEDNGMIVKLDQYIWRLACEQLKKWQEEGKDNLFLSVNISARDFEAIDVCQVISGLVKEYEIDARKLRLEITETALMNNVDSTLNVIERLREQGFIVEIDDFGSGYSSLNMLKDIIADVVKLDMKFLHKSKNEERSKTILRMMVALVKELNMQILVEGVETEDQLDFLKELDCDAFQGYFFMRPMSEESFRKEIK